MVNRSQHCDWTGQHQFSIRYVAAYVRIGTYPMFCHLSTKTYCNPIHTALWPGKSVFYSPIDQLFLLDGHIPHQIRPRILWLVLPFLGWNLFNVDIRLAIPFIVPVNVTRSCPKAAVLSFAATWKSIVWLSLFGDIADVTTNRFRSEMIHWMQFSGGSLEPQH